MQNSLIHNLFHDVSLAVYHLGTKENMGCDVQKESVEIYQLQGRHCKARSNLLYVPMCITVHEECPVPFHGIVVTQIRQSI